MSSTKSRKDTRAVVALRARYRSPATFEYVQEACTDVSVGGMFIKSDSPVAAGTLIKLECETDGDGAKIRGVARVVWLRLEANEHGPTGMGVKFVKLESGSKDVITRLVQRLADQGIQARSISAPPEATANAASTVGSAAPGANPAAARRSAPAIGISSAPAPSLGSSPAARGLAAKISSKPAPAALGQVSQPAAVAVSPPAPAPAAQPAVAPQPVVAAQPPEPAAAPAPAPTVDAQPVAPAAQPVAAPAQPIAAAPGVVARAATSSGDSGEVATVKKGGSGLVWLGVVVAVGVLLAIIFADDSANAPPAARSDSQPATSTAEPSAPAPAAAEPTPTPAENTAPAEPAAPAPSEPAAAPAEPSAAAPEPTPTAAPEPTPATAPEATPLPARGAAANARNAAVGPGNAKKAASHAPAPAPTAEQAAPTQPANDKPVVNIVPEPAAPGDTPAPAPEAAPTEPAAAEPPPQAASDPAPSASAAGSGDYIVEFVSKPKGATITAGDKSIVAPGEINFGVMPKRVKVGASKDGYLPSSAWVDNTGFKRVDGVFRKRVHMSLPFEDPAAKPARNR